MRILLFAFCFLYVAWSSRAFAGGPEIEMDNAHVDDVVFDERGLTLKVTGTVKFFARVVPEDHQPENTAKWVTLAMEGGEIRYQAVNLDATSITGYDKYRARIVAMKGTNQHIQLWGTDATVTAGTLVTLITTNSTWPFTPVGDERRFKWEDLKDADAEIIKSHRASPSPTPTPSH